MNKRQRVADKELLIAIGAITGKRKTPHQDLIVNLQGCLEAFLEHHDQYHNDCYAQKLIEGDQEEYELLLRKKV